MQREQGLCRPVRGPWPFLWMTVKDSELKQDMMWPLTKEPSDCCFENGRWQGEEGQETDEKCCDTFSWRQHGGLCWGPSNGDGEKWKRQDGHREGAACSQWFSVAVLSFKGTSPNPPDCWLTSWMNRPWDAGISNFRSGHKCAPKDQPRPGIPLPKPIPCPTGNTGASSEAKTITGREGTRCLQRRESAQTLVWKRLLQKVKNIKLHLIT